MHCSNVKSGNIKRAPNTIEKFGKEKSNRVTRQKFRYMYTFQDHEQGNRTAHTFSLDYGF